MSILYWVLCTFYRVLCVLLLCIVCIVCIVIVCIVCIVIVYFYRGLCVLLLCIVIVEWSVYHCYCVEIEAFGGIEPRLTFSSHSVSKYKEIKMLIFGCFLMLPAIVSHWMSYCKTCFSPKSNFYLNRTMQRTLHNEHPRIFFSCYLLKCTPKMVHITLTNI